jgi:hypothetical protein
MLRCTSGIAAHGDAGVFAHSPLTNLFANI